MIMPETDLFDEEYECLTTPDSPVRIHKSRWTGERLVIYCPYIPLQFTEEPPVPSATSREYAVITKTPPVAKFRYNEEQNTAKVMAYISSTYGEHYGHDVGDKQFQVIDLWEGAGSLGTTARDTAQKYLARYGKKNGYNEKDLLKAIHYILLMMYDQQKKEASATPC